MIVRTRTLKKKCNVFEQQITIANYIIISMAYPDSEKRATSKNGELFSRNLQIYPTFSSLQKYPTMNKLPQLGRIVSQNYPKGRIVSQNYPVDFPVKTAPSQGPRGKELRIFAWL